LNNPILDIAGIWIMGLTEIVVPSSADRPSASARRAGATLQLGECRLELADGTWLGQNPPPARRRSGGNARERRRSRAWRSTSTQQERTATRIAAKLGNALISADAPKAILEGSPKVGRPFEDYEAVERDYYRRTGIFPIMHSVVVTRGLADKHPVLVKAVYRGF
jgi:hypothetical protein